MKIYAKLLLPVWFAGMVVTVPVHADGECGKLAGCAAKQCDLDSQIETARKEGSMRKLATLKDLRKELSRCNDKLDEEKK
jgi:hypothetical protein